MAATSLDDVDMNVVQQMFEAFSKFGDTKSDGKTITLSQADKWMKQAKVIDGKKITTTDTANCFNKFKRRQLWGDICTNILTTFGNPFNQIVSLSSDLYSNDIRVMTKTVKVSDFLKYVEELAKEKNIGSKGLLLKLTSCGAPGTTGATQCSATGAVDRITDMTLYTRSHKEHFKARGKGNRIISRESIVVDDGYVTVYKGKDTYGKRMSSIK